jgi:hypothetical protein
VTGVSLYCVESTGRHLKPEESSTVRKWCTVTHKSEMPTTRHETSTNRMSAGPKPRVKARGPSFFNVLVITSKVEKYFWPSAFVKPSVCIRDLTISSG